MIKNKLKVGTLAFHNSMNYGAVLQVYALHKILLNLGYDTEVIDYHRTEPLFNQKITLSKCRSIKDILAWVFLSKNHNIKHAKFVEFKKDNIMLSNYCFNKGNINIADQEYDKIIVGSDQVWNNDLIKHDYTFLLDFAHKNKCASYAASFGNSVVNNDDEYKTLLKKFKQISVREEEGKQIVKQLLGKDKHVTVNLDPTMLLPKSYWDNLAIPYKTNKGYVLLYGFFNKQHRMPKLAKFIANKYNLDIVIINNRPSLNTDYIYEKQVGPQDYLGLIKNAKYVITNSFHATAFSILFNKKFFVEPLQHGATTNSRLYNLLNMLRIKNRLLTSTTIIDDKFVSNKIDYDIVKLLLDNERADSKLYLVNLLSAPNKEKKIKNVENE